MDTQVKVMHQDNMLRCRGMHIVPTVTLGMRACCQVAVLMIQL